jgi:hypothetical protein
MQFIGGLIFYFVAGYLVGLTLALVALQLTKWLIDLSN